MINVSVQTLYMIEICQTLVRNVKLTFKPTSRQFENERYLKASFSKNRNNSILREVSDGKRFYQPKDISSYRANHEEVFTRIQTIADGRPDFIAIIKYLCCEHMPAECLFQYIRN